MFFMNRGGQKKPLGDQQPMKRAQRPALDGAGAAGAARDAARGGSDWTAAHGCSTPGGQQRWHAVLLS